MVEPLSSNFSVFTVKLHVGHVVGVRKFRNFTIICLTTSLLTEFHERSNIHLLLTTLRIYIIHEHYGTKL